MRHFSINAIENMPNLYNFLYPDGKNFSPNKMVLDLGLYEAVKIDVSNLKISTSTLTSLNNSEDSATFVTDVMVSNDVSTLHEFVGFQQSIYVPCPECKKTLAFTPIEFDSINTKRKAKINEENPKEIHRMSAFQSAFPVYTFRNDGMEIGYGNHADVDLQKGIDLCVKGILANISEFKRCFECTLKSAHKLYIFFTIHRAIDVCKKPRELIEFEKRNSVDNTIEMTEQEREISERYNKLNNILILEKVGQEPSMADLQMFDIEKYKSILTKERFRDFSMALGLFASGVGCGSLLYLRRIFESIVITAQSECQKLPEWDNDLYESKRFNEKIDYLESLGRKIIPDELLEVKTKIYGFLSKGVHELSEQEAMELFPHLKLAIELILDEQIAQKERNEKIKALKRTLNNQ